MQESLKLESGMQEIEFHGIISLAIPVVQRFERLGYGAEGRESKPRVRSVDDRKTLLSTQQYVNTFFESGKDNKRKKGYGIRLLYSDTVGL